MANPNFKSASLLNEKIEEFKVANNLSEQSHTYIKFIQNKLKNWSADNSLWVFKSLPIFA